MAWRAAARHRPHRGDANGIPHAALALGRRAFSRIEREPLWPVPAEVEVVVEVDKTDRFKIVHQVLERVIVQNRADDDQLSLYAKLLIGQTQLFIDSGAPDSRPLERATSDDQAGVIPWKLERHRSFSHG